MGREGFAPRKKEIPSSAIEVGGGQMVQIHLAKQGRGVGGRRKGRCLGGTVHEEGGGVGGDKGPEGVRGREKWGGTGKGLRVASLLLQWVWVGARVGNWGRGGRVCGPSSAGT